MLDLQRVVIYACCARVAGVICKCLFDSSLGVTVRGVHENALNGSKQQHLGSLNSKNIQGVKSYLKSSCYLAGASLGSASLTFIGTA